MSSHDNSIWFTEVFGDEGTAFGLEINARLAAIQSAYQFIEIYETRTFGKLMVIDGCVMLTERDNFLYHEMMSHPALFTHPAPRRVAIIGGGDCGTLREILKHPDVTEVIQIDIDEQVTRLAEQYFPHLYESSADPRALLLFEDGVAWIQNQPEHSLDILIVDSTDPVGPAAGLFTLPFYQECQRVLKPEGILIQQTESPLLHTRTLIAQIHQDLKAAGFVHVHTLTFPQPVYPTGWWSCTQASRCTQSNQLRETAILHKCFDTEYYNLETHRAALAQPEFMKRILKTGCAHHPDRSPGDF
jgi:spermidine synthase